MITLLAGFLIQDAYLKLVDAKDLQTHVTYLASDELEGRGTPSAGLDKAADYIAQSFKLSGIAPGNGESYFQETIWGRGKDKDAKVRNVIGIIPGSDPELKKTFVIVSAHYDHLGMAADGTDKVYNGANDDASGVSGVLEIGQALVKANPKRSVVLLAFYGEEKGLVGSQYYAANPVFPLKETIANVNIEQIGRTDDSEAPRVSAGSLTGFDFSTVGSVFGRIGEKMGVPVTGHPRYSAPFFSASDNLSLAMKGIPAHTICTAFEFADYHALGDHADKLDYGNMEKITRMITAVVKDIADTPEAPKWNEDNPRTKRYRDAAAKLQSGG